jgi:LuxR family transcriptional regulator, maltose regulon positive regulatory protein
MQPKTFRKRISLTSAEARVLILLASHRTLAAIARELGIGPSTVATHVQDLYKKLEVDTRAGALKRAEHAGWMTERGERL